MHRVLLLIVGLSVNAHAQHPPAFEKFLENRSARQMFTAHFEYSISAEGKPTMFFSSQAAGERYVTTQLRNSDGVYNYAPGNKPASPWLDRPIRTLFTTENIWQAYDGQGQAYVFPPDQRNMHHEPDLRRIGVHPVLLDQDFDDAVAARGRQPATYSEEKVGELYVVTAETGPLTAKWWIDPTRDWNVIRTEMSREDGVTHGMDIELKYNRHDGIWFPQRVEWWTPGHDKSASVIEIHAAQFNRPEHPVELTPTAIGVEVGTLVHPQGDVGFPAGFWDGKEVVDGQILAQRIESGELSVGPTVLRARAQARAGLARAPSLADWHAYHKPETTTPALRVAWIDGFVLSAWEEYTEAFIKHYQLDVEQTSAARNTCQVAQQKARDYLTARKQRFDQLRKQHDELRDFPTGAQRDALAKHVARRKAFALEYAKAIKPTREIFERDLAARLTKLPTRAQHAAHTEFSHPDIWANSVPFARLYKLDAWAALGRKAGEERSP